MLNHQLFDMLPSWLQTRQEMLDNIFYNRKHLPEIAAWTYEQVCEWAEKKEVREIKYVIDFLTNGCPLPANIFNL